MAAFVFSGCAYSVERRYVDFLADLCITERYEDCFYFVQKGWADQYTKKELQVLQQDIASWGRECEMAEQANETYIVCAQKLLQAIEFYETGEEAEAEIAVEHAQEYYREAQRLIFEINRSDRNDG